MAQTPPRPPHCCRAATDRVQLAGVLTKPVSPSGVLVAVTADELELTKGELTVPGTDASPFICEVTATVGAVA